MERRIGGILGSLAFAATCLAVALPAPARAQTLGANAHAGFDCVWAVVEPIAHEDVRTTARRAQQSEGDPILGEDVFATSVSIQTDWSAIAGAVTVELLSSCGMDTDAATARLAARGSTLRAAAAGARAGLIALEGDPDAVDRAFQRMNPTSRTRLAQAVHTNRQIDNQLYGALLRPLRLTRVNRTLPQQRRALLLLVALLGEHGVVNCLNTPIGAERDACAALARAGS